MGFAEDLEAILAATPAERQTALFSATISPTIARDRRSATCATRCGSRSTREQTRRRRRRAVRQVAYVVRRHRQARRARAAILDVEDPTSALVFGRTRGEVDDLAEALSARGHDAGALHGGLSRSSATG